MYSLPKLDSQQKIRTGLNFFLCYYQSMLKKTLKNKLNIKSDSQLAEAMKVSRGAVSHWGDKIPSCNWPKAIALLQSAGVDITAEEILQ